jgi:sugar lactone lactonase YvrE
MPVIESELFCQSDCTLGEGPFWDRERLHWVDILTNRLHSCDQFGQRLTTFTLSSHLGSVARWNDGWIAATQAGIGLLSLQGHFELLPGTPKLPPEMRFNDGKADATGRFWCGTMSYAGTHPAGSLYRVDKDGTVHHVLPGITISNGLAWDRADERFYFIDTPTRQVDVFDYHPIKGEITNRRCAVKFPTEFGLPDGMAIDPMDRLWVAFWGGGHVIGFEAKTGREIGRIRIPASLCTSCCLGPDRKTLYITSARLGLTQAQISAEPLAGSLFKAALP